MSRKTKLLILILLSLSVYFIYKNNNHNDLKITSIGDSLILGTNSYGIKCHSYIDYYQDYLIERNIHIEINNTYSQESLTISQLLEKIKTTPQIKRDLLESNQVILNIGYNDLIYKLALAEKKNQINLTKILSEIDKDYHNLLEEIRKYYKNPVIIIGYYSTINDDYYTSLGIKRLNNNIQKATNIIYIDTSKILSNNKKYFSNPKSHYPNQIAYQKIAQEIITKTLEKEEIIWYSNMALNYYDK